MGKEEMKRKHFDTSTERDQDGDVGQVGVVLISNKHRSRSGTKKRVE